MGEDGAKKLEKINQVTMKNGEPKNMDLSVGKYDLVVTQGANYATKRIEALNSMVEIARVNPAIMGIAGDLIVKAMDWDGADQIAERMKKMLPPQLQRDENDEEQKLPPEVETMIEQGKQQIEMLTKQLQEFEAEKDDKDDELRLKKYEIDVKAEIEMAKLATNAGLQPDDVIAIVNQILANAAQQPELEDDDMQQMPNDMMQQFEQSEPMPMNDEQLAMELMAQNDMAGGDFEGVQLPDLQQDDEVM
jgi:hypothetical protein